MAVLPPWIAVNPSQFLQAAQAGASAGAQVAGIRSSAQLARERMAQQAALAAAARADEAARAQAAMDLRRWEQDQATQLAAQKLSQDALQARDLLRLSERDKMMRNALAAERIEGTERMGMERLEAQKEHWRNMEKNQADRIKQQFNLPKRYHISTAYGNVIATDPFTLESKKLFSAPPRDRRTAAPSDTTVEYNWTKEGGLKLGQ